MSRQRRRQVPSIGRTQWMALQQMAGQVYDGIADRENLVVMDAIAAEGISELLVVMGGNGAFAGTAVKVY